VNSFILPVTTAAFGLVAGILISKITLGRSVKNLSNQTNSLRAVNEQLQDELSKYSYHHRLLMEINKVINQTMAIEQIANLLLQTVITLASSDAASLFLRKDLNNSDSPLYPVAHSGIIGRDLDALTEHINGLKDDALLEKPIFYNLIPNIKMTVPVIYDNARIGFINIHQMTTELDEEQKEFVANLSGQVALVLKNAIMYQQIKQQALQMEQKAITDGLTGLYNHMNFQQRLDEEMERSRRYQQPLCLILFDIDHFKKFNDTYGHQFGDFVLKELAQIVKNTIRKTDIAARYGGEEFVLILPSTDAHGGARAAEHIRQNVQSHIFTNKENTASVTVSLGLSIWDGYSSKAQLIEQADQALYESKENGRNQLTVYKYRPTIRANAKDIIDTKDVAAPR
jgi:diguanylate cyclase (GGDEF)-like protein